MKQKLSLLCAFAVLLALTGCGGQEESRSEPHAQSSSEAGSAAVSAPAVGEPDAEPEPDPNAFVPYADANQIPFEELTPDSGGQKIELSFQSRDADDTTDIDNEIVVFAQAAPTEDGGNQFRFSVSYSHSIEGDEVYSLLKDLSGYRGNIYLFDVYTGVAIPTPAERESIGPDFDRTEHCTWEQSVTVDGTDCLLSLELEARPYYIHDDYWFTVNAPAGYDRLGLIVTSSSAEVTEPIDISNYIAEGDHVYYFQSEAGAD